MVRVDESHNKPNSADEASSEGGGWRRGFGGGGGRGLPGGQLQPVEAYGVQTADYNNDNTNDVTAQASPSNAQIIPEFPMDENSHRYVGLVNQAMTCYLNSLVQSLYMTPEFRNAMYEWEYVATNAGGRAGLSLRRGESSIPCQLQKLFLSLQTTDTDALETRDLTASFGWSASEAYDQHDVQELCRLMFDALEHKWKGTKHEKLIQDLYRGTMEDFVKCLACGRESVKPDYFLDLPLAIKPFGAMQAFRSVEEALGAFVQHELLDGSNQYNCENCQSKQDAHKGLRIKQFPYLLTIQLKRFDFDYNTMHRIKLNDRMTFPDILDLNSYVHQNASEDGKSEDSGDHMEGTHKKQKTSDGSEQCEESQSEPRNPYEHVPNGDVRVGQSIEKEAVKELLKNGENVYELFSVMVHSGSAAGGHYYAYIKNLDQDHWYSFNDTRVEFASVSEIERSFGGHAGGWNSSNTNAYMLMYRKVDPSRNKHFVQTKDLPPHIKCLQERWKQQEKEAEEQRLLQQSLLTVTVGINYPHASIIKRPDQSIVHFASIQHQVKEDFIEYVTEIPRTQTISTVFNQAFDFFAERAKSFNIPLTKNNCRLIHKERTTLYKTFSSKADMEKKTLKSLFDPRQPDPCPLYNVQFILDYRFASAPFAIEPYGGRVVQIKRVDVGARIVLPHFIIYIKSDEKILRVKSLTGAQFRDDAHSLIGARLILQCTLNGGKFLLFDQSMNGVNFMDVVRENVGNSIPILYYDGGLSTMCSEETKAKTEEDRQLEFEKSVMFEILDRNQFAMNLRIRFPSQDEISRAVSTSSAYAGPTWAESQGGMIPDDTSYEGNRWTKTRGEQSVVSKDPIDTTMAEVDEEVNTSGRASSTSMASIGSDGDNMIEGSFCNNTPQVSPSVSEGDEYDVGQSEITDFELRNQFNAQRTIDFMTSQQFQNMPAYEPIHDSFASPPICKKQWKTEDNLSEVQSATSSGHSTLVPTSSASSFAASVLPTASTSLSVANPSSSTATATDVDGKIVVLTETENYRSLDVDSRLSVGELKTWISTQLNVDQSKFVIVKHTTEDGSDSGYEVSARDGETVSKTYQSCMISVKLRAPLKQDEKLIQVVQFDMLENQRENWRTLFEIAASQKTLIGDVMLQCIRMYKEIYGEELRMEQVRLRDMPIGSKTMGGRIILRPNDTMDKRSSQWSANLYMQILTDEASIGKKGEPVLVRRFRPSSAEVSKTHEILVDGNTANQVRAFVEAVSKVSQIPMERVAIMELPNNSWEKWPFVKSTLDMLDGKVAFSTDYATTFPYPNEYLERVGTHVIYYKDADEEPKDLTEEERKQIKIKENGQSSAANRRKERPLRIQMSSVCES